MNVNLYMADYYFSMLNALSSEAKLYLMKRLADSLLKMKNVSELSDEAEKDAIFYNLAGVWANDPEADEMASLIRDGRISHHTRNMVSFDE